jgi:hypothetical protein
MPPENRHGIVSRLAVHDGTTTQGAMIHSSLPHQADADDSDALLLEETRDAFPPHTRQQIANEGGMVVDCTWIRSVTGVHGY